MACNCCKCCNLVTVSSIAVAGGITTLTIPADTVLKDGENICLGLFLTIPVGTNGTAVNVTNGTTTWTIYNKIANWWRPCCGLKSRTILKLKYYDDPAHLLKM